MRAKLKSHCPILPAYFIDFFLILFFQAAILQQTAEYIYSLEQEKTRLLAQNCQLKRLLSLSQSHVEDGATSTAASTVAQHGGNGPTLSVSSSVPTLATSSGIKRRRSKHDQGMGHPLLLIVI